MRWFPLYDKVIVRREAPDETLAEGIVAADKFKKKKNRGLVVEVGSGRISAGVVMPLTIRPGMVVLFGEHSGVELEEKDHIMLREDEILAWGVGEAVAPPA